MVLACCRRWKQREREKKFAHSIQSDWLSKQAGIIIILYTVTGKQHATLHLSPHFSLLTGPDNTGLVDGLGTKATTAVLLSFLLQPYLSPALQTLHSQFCSLGYLYLYLSTPIPTLILDITLTSTECVYLSATILRLLISLSYLSAQIDPTWSMCLFSLMWTFEGILLQSRQM